MRPPKCVICNRILRDKLEFARASFKLTQEEADYNREMRNRKPKIIGWPLRGEAWFCEDHIEPAGKLGHLSLSEAIQQIKNGSAVFTSRAR